MKYRIVEYANHYEVQSKVWYTWHPCYTKPFHCLSDARSYIQKRIREDKEMADPYYPKVLEIFDSKD